MLYVITNIKSIFKKLNKPLYSPILKVLKFLSIIRNKITELGSILVVSLCARIHKAPSSIPLYDHFPGFPHKRFLQNMVVRVTVVHFAKFFESMWCIKKMLYFAKFNTPLCEMQLGEMQLSHIITRKDIELTVGLRVLELYVLLNRNISDVYVCICQGSWYEFSWIRLYLPHFKGKLRTEEALREKSANVEYSVRLSSRDNFTYIEVTKNCIFKFDGRCSFCQLRKTIIANRKFEMIKIKKRLISKKNNRMIIPSVKWSEMGLNNNLSYYNHNTNHRNEKEYKLLKESYFTDSLHYDLSILAKTSKRKFIKVRANPKSGL
ncbi:hypothetical protein H8356DRAFT_1361518 [Neocallimastix lanati (nom. inval.)]|nr:hypothetical protein H8356DRAFT_1361518 [Neocallimastix sp. JGI-2020a]